MCIRDRLLPAAQATGNLTIVSNAVVRAVTLDKKTGKANGVSSVSYTHLRAHETVLDLVCRLLLEKKKKKRVEHKYKLNTQTKDRHHQ